MGRRSWRSQAARRRELILEQVAVGVGYQAAQRVCAVDAIEAGQDCGGARVARGSKGAVIDDLEHRTVAARAAALCGPEQIAVGVGDQAAPRG
jgi:hypothetical protein